MPHSEETPRPPSILRQEFQDTANQCASPRTYLGMNLSQSPRATPKSVSIAPETEVISPLVLGNQKEVDELDLDHGRRSRKGPLIKRPSSKRLTGRPQGMISPALRPTSGLNSSSGIAGDNDTSSSRGHSRHGGQHLEHLIDQVSAWIKEERAKHADRKTKRHSSDREDDRGTAQESHNYATGTSAEQAALDGSAESFNLDKLESIIRGNLDVERRSRRSRHRSPTSLLRKGSLGKQRKPSSASSDTEYFGDDVLVPSCDAILDNSQTLSYTGGASDDSDVSSSDELERTTSYRDVDAWSKFKFEIVRLSHTLRLKGWRRVPMAKSHSIEVKRLSGALTNAVYVVSPPSDLPSFKDRENSNGNTGSLRKPPPKLLLRIYGPQVGHLIDREAELAILRRLARKRIGPRLLGTFTNGRFEEYLYTKTLTAADLRNPDTSRQIAKRMRELHDGIELLDTERDDGPFVWRNWDKWMQRVEQVMTWLDNEIMQLEPGTKPTGPASWKRRGLICGVLWQQFQHIVAKYRKWLYAKHGGAEQVRNLLVFAHNDTQYGNILRLLPTGESPLLLPANSHKQLVVIDFEYASANVPGLEFANHFTEWCYDYHDERRPYAFHPARYPTPEEQERFIRAYVRHRPQINASTPNLTPVTTPAVEVAPGDPLSRRPTSSISDLLLDARTPQLGALNSAADEVAQKAAEDQEVARFMRETRMWRLANTAMWVAWAVIQAKVPGMPDFSPATGTEPGPEGEEVSREELGERAEEYRELTVQQQQQTEQADGAENEKAGDEFDYLGYAQHRAMFFWADAIQLGLVKAEELPEDLRGKVKNVPY